MTWRKSCSNIAFISVELRGVPKQSSIGFLTLLEAHRYCEASFSSGIV